MGRWAPPFYDRNKKFVEKQLEKNAKKLKANEEEKIALLADKKELEEMLADIIKDENK